VRGTRGNLGSFRPDQGALYLFTVRSDSHSNTNMRYFSITQNATTEQLPFHTGCLAANQEPAGIIATAMLRYLHFYFVLFVSLLLLPSVARAGSRNESVCTFSGSAHDLGSEAKQFGAGLKQLPRAMIRPSNLRWELPIGAATGVLIAKVDRPAADRIQSHDLINTASTWSNIGLGGELGSSVLMWGLGCHEGNSNLSRAGFATLSAMGAAGTVDLVLKLSFNRQFPFTHNSTGEFWEGGRSFPSGHSATSFAFAAAISHYYPRNPWINWGAYALATGVTLSRYPAKKHYLSDILMGATVGYVTGSYVANH
jgi:membrane-associated phospholipid phosphatase